MLKSEERRGAFPAMAVYAAIAFLLGFAVLAWRMDRSGIAATYIDPIAHVRAQDEATYVNSAMRMAQDGDWLTPKLMGRPYLFKPPLVIWCAALSLRAWGWSLAAVRLPIALLGAAGIAAIFAWVARARSVAAGVLAAGVLVLSPFWQTFSRLCLTDMPAIACATLALMAVAFDPPLDGRRTRLAFGIFAGLSILAKSAAGLIPFAALGLWCSVAPRRPRWRHLAETFAVAFLVAAPWHIYELVAHRQWFWADYVQVQLLGFGLKTDRSGILERSLPFYLFRLVRIDPLLALLAGLGLPAAFKQLISRRQPAIALAVCWLLSTAAALIAFQSTRIPYVLFLLPPLCIVGASCGPGTRNLRQRGAAIFLGIALLFKMAWAAPPWSLRQETPPIPQAQEVREYYALHRDAELIVADPADEFYAATLPLPGLRYCFLDPEGIVPRIIPHYVPLGIVLTSEQFATLPQDLSPYANRLRSWGVESPEPIGAAITLRVPAEIAPVIRARPQSDFSLPAGWISAEEFAATHTLWRSRSDRMFLLSRTAHSRGGVIADIPERW